jgi:hypothetical protein
MSIGVTSDRVLSRFSRQGVLQSFCFDLASSCPANGVDDPLSLPDAQLAALRRALEVDLGPELSGIRVYIGPKAGHKNSDAVSDHRAESIYSSPRGCKPDSAKYSNAPVLPHCDVEAISWTGVSLLYGIHPDG